MALSDNRLLAVYEFTTAFAAVASLSIHVPIFLASNPTPNWSYLTAILSVFAVASFLLRIETAEELRGDIDA